MHKDEVGQVIYVGKAINLKRRVSSYFVNSASHSEKVRSMVKHISEFEYITCKTEMEALILECNLIKKYEPKYNILLRDDKTYPYIKVTLNEEYPRLIKTRNVIKDGSRYFGPYSDVGAVNQIVELLNKIFSLKRCSAKSFSSDFRPCLNYHINECSGICTGRANQREYLERIGSVIEFLSGKQKAVIDSLTEKMQKASDDLDFENAAMYRDYITAAKALSEVQRVTMTNSENIDMLFPLGEGKNASVVMFSVRDGKLTGRETFYISDEGESDYETRITGFIKQYYSQMATPPKEIILQKSISEAELLGKYLGTTIYTPQRGDKYQLMKLALHDVIEMSKSLSDKAASDRERNDELRKILSNLTHSHKDRYRIESYDISNTNGVDTVGAMVVFFNLKPAKKEYRRFKIRTVEGPDDYGALQEMLYRRFKRTIEGDSSFSELPDLILMDGGQGQVTSALKVIRALKLNIPVLGMAKDDSHRTRALVDAEGNEFLLKEYPFMFTYCGNLQEEVHRFAIDYHHSLHNRNSIGSLLDGIPGIGPKKRNSLLMHFDSIENIKHASAAELKMCPGITEKNARDIIEFFMN